MKWGMRVVVAVALLIQNSDIRQQGLARGGATREVAALIRGKAMNEQLFLALWGDGWGAMRSVLIEPASPRLDHAYQDVVQSLESWKFSVRIPSLYQTTSSVELLISDPPGRLYGRYFVGPNRILVNQQWTDRMDENELRVLLAHEFGHAIDAQTERVGHWTFPDVYGFNSQQFADHIARLATSDEAVREFNRKYVGGTVGDE